MKFRNFSAPFPHRVDFFVQKSFAAQRDVRKIWDLDQKIQQVKNKLQILIQANYPMIPVNPFIEPVAAQYMHQYFGQKPLGQDWQRNILIQNMLIELNKLEKERRDLQ